MPAPIQYNANASQASANYARAMQERGAVERGGNTATVEQKASMHTVRASLFQPAKASTLGRDIRAGVVVAAVVFGVCCVLMALHII